MAPGRRSCAAGTILLLCASVASADHWVSIGAFRATQTAERLAAEAGEKMALSFSVLPAETREGKLHRVATGPFPSRNAAQADLVRARSAGFVDAWIMEIDAPAASEPTSAAKAEMAPSIPDAWNSDLPPIEVLLRDLPDMPESLPPEIPTIEEPDEDREMVVPDDYQLNKMLRDGTALRKEATSAGLGTFDLRLKWYTTAQSLPAGDAQRLLAGESTPVDHNADLRLMWRRNFGPLRVIVDYAAIWLYGDTLAAGSPGITFDQTPTGDERRLMGLTWNLDDDDQRLHRFDRLAVEYRSHRWGVTAGRQALSWGGGLVFQPMDLFNPFAPTTIDQDYKAGDDLVLVEGLFGDGSDLQVLAVGRRSYAGDPDLDASSFAVKYRGLAGENEYELMASHHYGNQVYGIGLRIPAGGALVRSDITWTLADDRVTLSGLLNADYSFGIAGSVVHVFAEYFHNGFGVTRLPDDLSLLPAPLAERIGRGELFNTMRNYLAAGTSFRWHFLLNQSIAVIANLHDSSYVAQASLTYDASDASRLQVGFTMPVGNAGDEFGGLTVGEDLTTGGGDRGFLRFVYFF